MNDSMFAETTYPGGDGLTLPKATSSWMIAGEFVLNASYREEEKNPLIKSSSSYQDTCWIIVKLPMNN